MTKENQQQPVSGAMTEESNVIKGAFASATPTQEALVDELYTILNKYAGHLTLATMVGLLEMVKADVLDSMIKR